MANILTKVFGSRNDRLLRKFRKTIQIINGLESKMEVLDDAALSAKTTEFQDRIANGESLDSILPEAFAVVREASRRTLNLRHYDVQLVGGIVIHQGKIAEMRTGEGKTLMSTLPAYLNALSGDGVHIVTVNDYLAKRDAEWMAPIYNFLNLEVATIFSGQAKELKQAAYNADITYGTNNEFGFDYLRNNLAFSASDRLQRGLNFAIVDEVDSILIDEARTPLIISGPAEDSTDLYLKINKLIPNLEPQTEEDGPGDYRPDEKSKQVHLSEDGFSKVEGLMHKAGLLPEGQSLYDASNIILMHHLNAAMRAHALYIRDVDYIIQDGEVVIVDEFTGRTMPGRRWSDGLHQAIEAKEGQSIQSENQTLASITFQNYFRMYQTLSGMTGTADTEAYEFQSIYGLEVVVIPTHKPMVRDDRPDLVYRTSDEKFRAIVNELREINMRGRPVLVGTASIETSELLSALLKKEGVPHNVLNAKQHEREAEIVANAGQLGAVTIATNMAGRGTDIALGTFEYADLVRYWVKHGYAPNSLNENTQDPAPLIIEQMFAEYFDQATIEKHQSKSTDAKLKLINDLLKENKIETLSSEHMQKGISSIVELGGLHILGTERHESRRIDNQLRGRAGRQGDPGSSRFYISLQDNLMRIFGDVKRMDAIMRMLPEDQAIESKMLSRQIEGAQRKVEAHNFDMRKNLLEYDDVANEQRKLVYELRNDLMDEDDVSDIIESIRDDSLTQLVEDYIPPQSVEQLWDVSGLSQTLSSEFGSQFDIQAWMEADSKLNADGIRERVIQEIESAYADKEQQIGSPTLRHFEKAVMLQQLDMHWKEHLAAMDHLRQSIGLRSYAQKNPKQEYKKEAFTMFNTMLDNVKRDTVSILARVRVRDEQEVEEMERRRQAQQAKRNMQFKHAESSSFNQGDADAESANAAEPVQPFVREGKKVGRNTPCPCGSGKKYKHCHGKLN
ncbi:MAG: preprotein translocase subunit SecA [Gammaproteobacteria bacterium]|nr:preprotein translocase subunit SecA [Gammaproteobacteria bacterium]